MGPTVSTANLSPSRASTTNCKATQPLQQPTNTVARLLAPQGAPYIVWEINHSCAAAHTLWGWFVAQPSQNNHTSVQGRLLPLTKIRLPAYSTHALLTPKEHKSKAHQHNKCGIVPPTLCQSLTTAPTSYHKPLCVVTDAAQHQGQKGPCPADTRMSQHSSL
jgi:hypothetical protein